ncbi:MAG: hypothetical protein ACRDLZ_04570 [Gaiellaceae bacterium]
MRKTVRTIAATLAIVAFITASAALSDFVIDPGASVLTGTVSVSGEVAAEDAPLFFLDGRTLAPLAVNP